jgi:sugar phosphate isomerase/epimerase
MAFLPSACIWNFQDPITEVLTKVKQTAFHYIDVEPGTLSSPEALQKLRELGLKVSCVAIDHGLPEGVSLEGDSPDRLRRAVDHLKGALETSRELGASVAYLRPCANKRHLKPYGASVAELADDASRKGIKLCLEHVPSRALPTVKETLNFLEQAGHSNLYLLLDIGHALISREDPAEAVLTAGVRLGYVQMNDNDGKKDRHWALLDGRLTEQDLVRTIKALEHVGYAGALGLELDNLHPSLISALARNRNLLMRLQSPVEIKSLKQPEERRKQ